MKLGTHIVLPDGRKATVVYNSLDGVGIKWGIHEPDPEDFKNTNGNLFRTENKKDWPWFPEAMLRNPDVQRYFDIPCVGESYELI